MKLETIVIISKLGGDATKYPFSPIEINLWHKKDKQCKYQFFLALPSFSWIFYFLQKTILLTTFAIAPQILIHWHLSCKFEACLNFLVEILSNRVVRRFQIWQLSQNRPMFRNLSHYYSCKMPRNIY